jgi:hypothetical protein
MNVIFFSITQKKIEFKNTFSVQYKVNNDNLIAANPIECKVIIFRYYCHTEDLKVYLRVD